MKQRMTHKEWLAMGAARFGSDPMKWRFVCPACKHIASVQDWKDAGAPDTAVAISCVGRWKGCRRDALGLNPEAIERGELLPAEGAGPCNYAGYGLFALNPIIVVLDDGSEMQAFAFAEREEP